MLSGRAGPRLLNETSVQLEVWEAYAELGDADQTVDLLLTPYGQTPASQLARALFDDLRTRDLPRPPRLAPLEGVVAVSLRFSDFVDVVLPRTRLDLTLQMNELRDTLAMLREPSGELRPGPIMLAALLGFSGDWKRRLSPDMRAALLVAVILTAQQMGLYEASDGLAAAAAETPVAWGTGGPAAKPSSSIFRVSVNRPVEPMGVSVETIKADAAHRVFDVSCAGITWAVIDSGIDGSHPAFRDHDADDSSKIRIDKAYDFTKVRELASYDVLLDPERLQAALANISDGLGISDEDASKWLARLREDAENGRPFDWQALSRLLEVRTDYLPPQADGQPNGHGTHVAGVLAGDWRENGTQVFSGVCPDLRLYDLRVLGQTLEETEFAVVAALEFVRWVNTRNRFITIHGANLSLGLKHKLTDYACGRTPVCLACEATVDNGVSVVAAVGNWGTQDFVVGGGTFTGYAAISIADPGNAESVITVGSTHRDRPHEYGVSFFSSRGPTGDGRRKPDVVAPGERIDGPLPNLGFGRLDGTSMAAPHVSGVAALLMARNRELIGRPRRVKAVVVETATDLGRERDFQGAGLVDALRALQSV